MKGLDEPHWGRILREMNQRSIVTIANPGEGVIGPNHKIVQGTGLGISQFHSALMYLNSMDLVKKHDDGSFTLTKEGMKIAQQREIASQQLESSNNTNRAVGFLTLGLLLVNTFGIAINSAQYLNMSENLVIVGITASFLVVLMLGVYGVKIGLIGNSYYNYRPDWLKM